MGKFNDWINDSRSNKQGETVEFYEDTHNEKGEYLGEKYRQPSYTSTSTMKETASMQLPNKSQFISPRHYQNVIVYEPKSPEDVQTLIDYLKRREPAIVNLDNAETDVAQRILDFLSGAIYSLSGSIHRIASNIFLLSPEGVEITIPYDIK